MGLFKCCCSCEGCGRGQLDLWTADTAIAPKTRWAFQYWYPTGQMFSNFTNLGGVPLCGNCERRFSNVSDTGGLEPPFECWTDWKWGISYFCSFDVDGDLTYSHKRGFYAIKSIMTPTWRIMRGKAYRDCNPSLPEECTYLVVAKLTGHFMVYRAFWQSDFTSSSTSPTYPEIDDIPPRNVWVPTGNAEEFTYGPFVGGVPSWRFSARRVIAGGAETGAIITTPLTIVRARTFGDLTESRLDIPGATGNCGLIVTSAKHVPNCCSIWDCPSESIDCSANPTMTVAVSASPSEFFGCPFSTLGGLSFSNPSWEISGGNWSIYDVA